MNSFEEHKNYLIYLGDEVIFRAPREMPNYRRNLSLFIEPKNQTGAAHVSVLEGTGRKAQFRCSRVPIEREGSLKRNLTK